ncbi:MAG: hypothetical protein JW942_06110 [Opitutales bacterium]|nr:hypothetical protein [Opitutales bacterium]
MSRNIFFVIARFLMLVLLFMPCSMLARVFDLGEPYNTLDDFDDIVNAGRYGDVYSMMSTSYRSVVSREYFCELLNEGSWKIVSWRFGSISPRKTYGYVPVLLKSEYGGGGVHVHSVLFLIKEDNVWKFDNFPFLPPYVMEYGQLPSALNKEVLDNNSQ